MTGADEIEIDFALEDGRILTAWLGLDGQEAQKSHGLCKGRDSPTSPTSPPARSTSSPSMPAASSR